MRKFTTSLETIAGLKYTCEIAESPPVPVRKQAARNNPPGEVCTYLDGKLRDLSQKLRHGLNLSDLFFPDTK